MEQKSKKITKLELYYYVIGGTIGSGLFILIPIAIGMTGKSAIWATLVAAVIALFAGFYNIIIASMVPLSGGDYSQVAFVAPPYIAGVYGVIWLISSVNIGGFAASTIRYLVYLIPGISGYEKLVTVLILTFFFVINYFGAKFGAKIEGFFTILMLVTLGAFIVVGLPKVDVAYVFSSEDMFIDGFGGFSSAVAMIMFAMMGPALNAVGLAKEVERPTKDVPRAIIGGSLLVAVIYFFIVLVGVGVLPYAEVAFQELTVVADAIFPRWLYMGFLLFGACFALLSTLMSSVTVFRYPAEQLVDEGWLPAVFKKKTKNGWPWLIMVSLYIVANIPILFDISMDQLISYTSIPGCVVMVVVTAACASLPKKYPEHWKKSMFHMPLPIYYVLCALAVLANFYVTYSYLVDLTPAVVVFSILTTVVMFAYVLFCLKTKRVDPAYLEEQKEKVIAEAIAYIQE